MSGSVEAVVVAQALALYGYNVSALDRAEAIYRHFGGACAEMDELVDIMLHYGSAPTALAFPSAEVYVRHAMERYGEEASRRVKINREADRERAAEVEFCAAEARPEIEARMVCYDGKSWCTTVHMPAEAERLGWHYVQGGLSPDCAEVLLLALACGLAHDPDGPDYTEPLSLKRLRRAAGVDR